MTEAAKRILVLTADAGFGHRSAARAIALAVEETCGTGCTVDVVNPLDDESAPSLLRDSQTDYDRIVRAVPDLYRLGYTASDAAVPSTLLETALIVLLYEAMRKTLKRYQPDAIVTTYPLYQAPLDAVFSVSRRRTPLLTVVTDLSSIHRIWFNAAADLCLVPTEPVRRLALDAGLAEEQVRLTGIPVNPRLARQGGDKAALRARLGWRADLTTLLVVGSKRVEGLPGVLRGLNHSGLPLQLALVAGGDDELHRALLAEEWHLPAHVYNFVADMPAMLGAADAILCKAGGLIVTEALACGLPLVLIEAIPGQETGNAEFVVANGAGVLAEDPLAVLEAVFAWLQDGAQRLKATAANARALGRPNAAYEVAALAQEAAAQGSRLPKTRLARQRERTREHMVTLLQRYNILPAERAAKETKPEEGEP